MLQRDLDYIFCICFDENIKLFENDEFESKLCRITFNDNKFVSNSVIIKHDMILEMIERGYEHTKEVLKHIFVNGIENKEEVLVNISSLKKLKSGKHRITGDVIVDNMNKLSSKLVTRGLL